MFYRPRSICLRCRDLPAKQSPLSSPLFMSQGIQKSARAALENPRLVGEPEIRDVGGADQHTNQQARTRRWQWFLL